MPTRSITSDRPLPTVATALANGCQVDALCLTCDHIGRLDLLKLSQSCRADVPLIELPLVCRCGSKRSRIIVSGEAYRN